jgi:hypothetical protein
MRRGILTIEIDFYIQSIGEYDFKIYLKIFLLLKV